MKTHDRQSTVGRRSRFRRGWVAAGLVALLAPLSALHAFEQFKLAMERALEERIQFALSKFVNPEEFLVIVKVEPYTVDELKKMSKSPASSSGAREFVLPGIPERKKLDTKPEEAAADVFWQGRSLVKRLSVTLFMDKRIGDDLVQQLEILAKQLVDFDATRNDEMRVQRMNVRRSIMDRGEEGQKSGAFQALKLTMDDIKTRKDFYWLILAAVASGVMILFLFGPFFLFLRKLPKILKDAFPPANEAPPDLNQLAGGGRGGDMTGKMEMSSSAPMSLQMGGPDGRQVEIFLGEPEKQPYNFLNEKDIVNILLLMKDEPPLHLAIIAYYLRPDLSAAMVSGLDSAVRKQILEHLAAPQILMRDEVKSLGQTLKQKVRGVIYGVDQYFAIYDSASPAAQTELIKALEAQTPALVEKMRNEMFSFDDLIALDSSALRVVFREVPLRTLATALMGTAVSVRDRILGVLPSGAAEIIRQEIEMNATQNPKAIEEERKKIVTVVRRLVWDKKIAVPPRQRGGGARTSAPAPVATA
jgi:hypothetical protein